MLKLIAGIVLMGTLCASQPLPTDEQSLRATFQTMLDQLDSDGDSHITLAEFLPMWRPAQPNFGAEQFAIEFNALDLDSDGAVSADDFVRVASQPAPPQMVPLAFDAADNGRPTGNANGRLTEAEAERVASALNLGDAEHVRYAVQHADHDGDGSFDLAEFVDATEELRRGGS